MIKTYNMLLEEYVNYKAPVNKLLRLIENGKYIKLTKGLYETDKTVPGYLLANAIYNPSYLSFEFALSYHGLIPEAVYTFTSATYKKKKKKKYVNYFGTFTYRDVPDAAFPYEIEIHKENQYIYRIASAEKALCDKLYSMKPLKSQSALRLLLFDDLRIDETRFHELNKETLVMLCDLYGVTNLKLLKKMLMR